MARTVKDVVYLDTNQTEAAPSTISDQGNGTYPQVHYKANGLLYCSGATTSVVIPWDRVIKVTQTIVTT
jgi:sporulation protein YlmC with PRC-barrel domain